MPGAADTVTATRLATAGALLDLDAAAPIDKLVKVTDRMTGAMAFTDADVRTFAVGVDLPNDEWLARRMVTLAEGVSPSKFLSRAAVGRAGAMWVERGTGRAGAGGEGMAGMYATLAIAGKATLRDDLDFCAAVGLEAAALAEARARLTALGDDGGNVDRVVRVTIYSGQAPEDATVELGRPAPPDLIAKLKKAAASFGIGAPQLRLLDQIHPILEKTPPVWVRIATRADVPLPGVVLAYNSVPLETCQRVVNGLANDQDAGMRRFGTLVGALGVETGARSLELALGPVDPVPVRFGLVVSADGAVNENPNAN